MFENEDVILPDDYQADLPQSEEVVSEEAVDTGLDTIETEQADSQESNEQQIEEQNAFLKVKYNKEEMDLDEATAKELAQKGLNYDKTLERLQALESDPRLTFVEELAQEQGMDVNEFLDAVRQSREQQRLDELVQQNIPEEYAKEIMENRKFREQFEQQQKEKAEQDKQSAEYTDLFNYFKEVNGRDFDTSNDVIPDEVWQKHAEGVPLRFAYMEHHNQQLQQQLKVLKQNETNKQKAPVGSLSAHGSTEIASEDDFMRGFNSI